VLAWFVAIPFRYVLLDIPGRFEHMRENPLPNDPKDLWPMDGPFVVLMPLWIALSLGAWAVLIGSLLLPFMGFTAAVVSSKHLGAHGLRRWAWTAFGLVLTRVVARFALVDISGDAWNFYYGIDKGLTAAGLGGLTLLAGLGCPG